MTNKELMRLIEEFIEDLQDTDEDEWYGSSRDFAIGVMDWFKAFLKRKGLRIKED